jgi:hypothetical protein
MSLSKSNSQNINYLITYDVCMSCISHCQSDEYKKLYSPELLDKVMKFFQSVAIELKKQIPSSMLNN